MSYEPPTLEGRVLVDLGQQLTAMRARAEQAEADNVRLRKVTVPVGTLDPDVCRTLGHGTVVCQDCGTVWLTKATA